MERLVSQRVIRWFCSFLIFAGIAGRLYGINDPWKANDHYNFGGVMTTVYTECMKKTPLEVSRGVVHKNCDQDQILLNTSQAPTLIFALWGWTSVFGNSEWAYRTFTLTFSLLSILIMFQIGRRAGRSEMYPWLAAAMQASFLGGIYFGTHLDFMSEFTVFFVLVTAWLALRRRWSWAGVMGIVAGVTSWPGFFVFPPLLLSSFALRQGRKRTVAFTIVGAVICLSFMAYLLGQHDLIDYLKMKIGHPGYLPPKQKDYFLPLRFSKNFIMSQSRLLGPFFCGLAFIEFVFNEGRDYIKQAPNLWRNLSPFHHAVLLAGGAGVVYAILGLEFVMIHVYLYLFLTPGLALLSARFIERFLTNERVASDRRYLGIVFVMVLVTALYPYGIFKNNAVHEAITSVAMIVGVLGFLFLLRSHKLRERRHQFFLALVAVAAGANISRVIDYRNEPDTEKSFCIKARAEYVKTGQPVHTFERETLTKDELYCRGIPIVYESGNAGG